MLYEVITTDVQNARIRIAGLGQYFPFVFTSEEIGVFTPATGFFDAVFAGIGQPDKDKCLVIV